MKSPSNINLPFFAYGIFKPGELGFLQLRDFVMRYDLPCTIKGSLYLRDGLPIIDPLGSSEVEGTLLFFKLEGMQGAYDRIAQLEPDHQYRWETTQVPGQQVNYLAGKSPRKGSVHSEENRWSGKDDPLFKTALEVVETTLRTNREFNLDLKPLFQLEMAYMLLWSCIERYCSFRYGLGDNVMAKIKHMADDPVFATTLRSTLGQDSQPELVDEIKEGKEPPMRESRVFRADRPLDHYTLSADNPEKSLLYYYQIRCNAVHRGKSAIPDHKRVEQGLADLLDIFRKVLAAAFAESARPLPQS